MKTFIHRCVRRLVVWASTKSDEENQALIKYRQEQRERYDSRAFKASDLQPVSTFAISDELHEHDPVRAGEFIKSLQDKAEKK